MNICNKCYSNESRITPLLNPKACLENYAQYICGTCELVNTKGRKSYKIFSNTEDF